MRTKANPIIAAIAGMKEAALENLEAAKWAYYVAEMLDRINRNGEEIAYGGTQESARVRREFKSKHPNLKAAEVATIYKRAKSKFDTMCDRYGIAF